MLTTGDPAGIGPDVCLQMAQYDFDAKILAIGDIKMLRIRAETMGLKLKIIACDDISQAQKHKKNSLQVYHINCPHKVHAGILNYKNSSYVLKCIDFATDACVSKQADAMITSAVHKATINKADFAFSGHTEYIAELVNKKPVMMLAGDTLKVALLSTHLPLKDVSSYIDKQLIIDVVKIIHQDVKSLYNIKNPKIYLSGLNPHAGENGTLGDEETLHYIPAIKSLQQQGINITGVFAADTMFIPDNLKTCDVFLCSYHDQGLPVLKTLDFGNAINITLGLGFLRVSCDHGTALNLAGTNKSNCNSLKKACEFAINTHENY